MDWFSFDDETLLYIAIIVVFLAFFIWNSLRLKQNRSGRKNFRKRYWERKEEKKNNR